MTFQQTKKQLITDIEAQIVAKQQNGGDYGALLKLWSYLGTSGVTQEFVFTVTSGNTQSDWIAVDRTMTTKIMSLLCPSSAPSTTLTFESRPVGGGDITPIIADKDSSSLLTLNINGLGSFGANALARLASEVNREWRLVLANAPTSDAEFTLLIS